MPRPPHVPSTIAVALRSLARIDRSAISPIAGAIALVPVVALVGLGLLWWGSKTAVTLALGAHLIAVASTLRSSRSNYSLLVLNALVLAVATFVGSLTESIGWLHVVVLAVVCLGGGLLVAIGPQLAIIGTQAVLAFLIFGRYPEHAVGAVQLGALVLLGAAVEAAFLSAVRWPPAFRRQRDAVAQGLSFLAGNIEGNEITSTVPAANEFDTARDLLTAPGALGRDDEQQLRAVVDEARRMRVEVAALIGLRRRLHDIDTNGTADVHIAAALHLLASQLREASQAVDTSMVLRRGDDPDDHLDHEITAAIAASAATPTEPLVLGCVLHLRALAGQLRAIDKILSQDIDHHWHLQGYAKPRHRVIRDTWNDWASAIRANLTLASPALRHALRLAVAVPAADVTAQLIGLPRSYWVPLTVAVVLRPDFGSLFTRGLSRVVGTTVGVAAAGFFIAGVHPDHAVIVLCVALTAWGAYSFYQSSFAVASSFVAAIVLFLLSVTQIDTTTTAGDRVLDTVLGGTLALVAYLVWPTWSSGQARMAIARLIAAQQRYLAAILTAPGSDTNEAASLRALARRARFAWTEAQATVNRSLAEPSKWRVDRDVAQSLLAACLRIIQAAHALRSNISPDVDLAQPSLRQLIQGIDEAMTSIGHALEQNRAPDNIPELRTLYEHARAERSAPALLIALDDIIDAINTAAHVLNTGQLEHVGQ